QAENMARDGMQTDAARELALDIGNERASGAACAEERRWGGEQLRINGEQPPGLLIGRAAHHHAVEMVEMLLGLLNAGDATIEHDRKPRMRGLEPVDAAIIKRRHVAVLARREPLEPGLARVHNERVDARALDRGGERLERLFRVLLVD